MQGPYPRGSECVADSVALRAGKKHLYQFGGVSLMADLRSVLVIDGTEGVETPSGAVVHNLNFRELTGRKVSEILPDLVIMPLFGPGFDAVETLAQLERFGFRGEVLVHTPKLPNSALVLRELSAAAPTLKVTLRGPLS